jgi:nucleoside phosphorylase
VDVGYDHLIQLEQKKGLDYTFLPEDADREYSVLELLEGVRDDGTRRNLASPRTKSTNALRIRTMSIGQADNIDLLIVTALTEEAQVVNAILSHVGTKGSPYDKVTPYSYRVRDTAMLRVATACAHQVGAVDMCGFASDLLGRLRPRSATLVGIAAAVDTSVVKLGDVPFASHVVSYDDLAVEGKGISVRPRGYPVDPRMLYAVGELRTSAEAYGAWQDECLEEIRTVIQKVSTLRQRRIIVPRPIPRPHLVVEVTAGGPVLLRDKGFRDSLRKPLLKTTGPHVTTPIHAKVVSAEMESHGFMRAAHSHNVPATVIKGISDDGDKKKSKLEAATGGFHRTFACSNAVLAILHIQRYVAEREPGSAFGLSNVRSSSSDQS